MLRSSRLLTLVMIVFLAVPVTSHAQEATPDDLDTRTVCVQSIVDACVSTCLAIVSPEPFGRP
jgi:hypothetical protein